jgi:hypothetical protein
VCGVFGPIDPKVSVEEIMELASAENTAISDIIRLNRFKNGSREPSATLKITFHGQNLPNKVKIGYVSYSVRPFVAPPLRCYRCQRLGHLAEGCNSPRRCLLCAGPHEHSVCTSAKKRCANCNGAHAANSLECPYIAKAIAVEKLRATGRTYAQAVKEVDSLQQQTPNGAHHPQASIEARPFSSSSGVALDTGMMTVDVHQSQGPCPSFEPVQIPLIRGNQVENQPVFKHNFTLDSDKGHRANKPTEDFRKIMREELVSSEKRLDDTIRASLTGYSIKLGKFLHEVFNINLLNEGAKERSLLLISSIRNAFGQEVSDVLQGEWLPACPVAADQGLFVPGTLTKTCNLSAPQLKKSADSGLPGRSELPVRVTTVRSSAASKCRGQTRARSKGKSASKQAQ